MTSLTNILLLFLYLSALNLLSVSSTTYRKGFRSVNSIQNFRKPRVIYMFDLGKNRQDSNNSIDSMFSKYKDLNVRNKEEMPKMKKAILINNNGKDSFFQGQAQSDGKFNHITDDGTTNRKSLRILKHDFNLMNSLDLISEKFNRTNINNVTKDNMYHQSNLMNIMGKGNIYTGDRTDKKSHVRKVRSILYDVDQPNEKPASYLNLGKDNQNYDDYAPQFKDFQKGNFRSINNNYKNVIDNVYEYITRGSKDGPIEVSEKKPTIDLANILLLNNDDLLNVPLKEDLATSIVTRKPAVKCGDMIHLNQPWGTCRPREHCRPEKRLFAGDGFCDGASKVCCAFRSTNFTYPKLEDAVKIPISSSEENIKILLGTNVIKNNDKSGQLVKFANVLPQSDKVGRYNLNTNDRKSVNNLFMEQSPDGNDDMIRALHGIETLKKHREKKNDLDILTLFKGFNGKGQQMEKKDSQNEQVDDKESNGYQNLISVLRGNDMNVIELDLGNSLNNIIQYYNGKSEN